MDMISLFTFFLCQSSHPNKNTFLASNRIFDKNHTLKVLLKKVITIPFHPIISLCYFTLLYFTYLRYVHMYKYKYTKKKYSPFQ